jgi:spore germination protein GerM
MSRPRGARGAATLVALVLCVLGQAGCGLSTNDEPEPLSSENVPDELEGATPGQPLPPVAGEGQEVWFLQSDADGAWFLLPIGRQVESPAGARQLLEALIGQPPDPEERSRGIATFVREDARVVGDPQRSGDSLLVVNLSESFYEMQGESSRYAFAQVVFTATGIDGIEQVRFQNEGRNFEVVDGEGRSRSRPVTRADYDNLWSEE